MVGKRPNTVFDKCLYKNCKNTVGNGYYLLRFPAEKDPRHGIWLQNAGNPRLEGWTASSIRKGGLCPVHFLPESFVDRGFPAPQIGRRRLQKTAVPIPYHEVVQKQVQRTASKPDCERHSHADASPKVKQTGGLRNVSTGENESEKTSTDLQCERRVKDAGNFVASHEIGREIPSLDCTAEKATEETVAIFDDVEEEGGRQPSASEGKSAADMKQYPAHPLLFSDIENDSMDWLNSEPPSEITKINEARTPLLERVKKNVGNDADKDRVISSLREENTALRNDLRNVLLKLKRAEAANKRLTETVKRLSTSKSSE